MARVMSLVEGALRADRDDRYPAARAAEALDELRQRSEPQVERTPRQVRRQRARGRQEPERKPLPWPVIGVLAFYRLAFILVGTAVVSMLTLTGLSFGAYRYLVTSMPPEVIVPDITNMPRLDARKLLEDDFQLGFEVIQERPSATVPEGCVVRTNPPPGRRVRAGRKVQVVISSGRELVTVPGLAEEELGAALDQLQRLGLKKGTVQKEPHAWIPADHVIRQDPGAGRRVALGALVHLRVSSGPPPGQEAGEKPAETETPQPSHSGAPGRRGSVRITVPAEPASTTVRIMVRDSDGERKVLDEPHQPGDVILKDVEGAGPTTVEVFLNDRLVTTKDL